MTIGIDRGLFSEDLSYVPVHLNHCPVRSFDAFEAMGPNVRKKLIDYYLSDDVVDFLHELPAKAFLKMGIDRAAKAMLSKKYSFSVGIEKELEQEEALHLVRKIDNSVWRWGRGRAAWNDIVDTYNGIRSFDMGIKGFTVTLDCTTGYNEKGYSREARAYLDGVFGFLVHWKGQHVMTIGFSIASGRRLLLQQVQATSKSGNRWMFKIPGNRMEFVLDRIRAAFPRHKIHIADGADYAKRSYCEYSEALDRQNMLLARERDPEDIARTQEAVAKILQKIDTIKRDTPRIASLYSDVGRYSRGKTYKANGMRHYALAA